MSAKTIFLNDTIELKDSASILKQISTQINTVETTDLWNVNYPTIIGTTIVGIIIAVSVIIFNHRPKFEEITIANYINATSNQRIRHYSYNLQLGWRWFPWGKIKWTKRLLLKHLSEAAYYELTYETSNDEDKFVPKQNQIPKPTDEAGEVGITNRSFFLNNHISTVFLKTWEPELSDYINRVSTLYYPNPQNPQTIVISNDNPVDVTDYIIDLTTLKTNEFIKNHPDYRQYLLVQNNDILSDCYVENERLHLVISLIPKHSGIRSGTVTINLA